MDTFFTKANQHSKTDYHTINQRFSLIHYVHHVCAVFLHFN